MLKSDLSELLTFLTIVEQGGVAKAAARLGVTPSAVSQSLKKLEDRLGVRLLNRTTRHIAPTSAGAELAARLRDSFATLETATQAAQDAGKTPRGMIRLAVSAVAADLLIAPYAAAFMATHPEVQLEVSISDRLVDIVADGYDAGIRRGDLLHADMIQQRLTADARLVAVAAPDYLSRRKACRTPEDLRDHDCIRIRSLTNGGIPPWHFAKQNVRIDVQVSGSLVVDTTWLALEAACHGAGVAYLGSDYLTRALASGRVRPLLRGWSAPRPGFFLYHPGRHNVPGALRLFTNYLRAQIKQHPVLSESQPLMLS